MSRMNRRNFMRLAGAAIAAAVLPACKEEDENYVNPSMERAQADVETYDEAVARYITTYLDSNYPECCKLGYKPTDAKDNTINVGSNAVLEDIPVSPNPGVTNGTWWPEVPPDPVIFKGGDTGRRVLYTNDGVFVTEDMGAKEVEWRKLDLFEMLEEVVKTIEYRAKWLSVETDSPDDERLIATHYLTDGSVVCVGDEGSMIKTFDMGATWYEVEHITDNGWLSVEDMEEVEF